MQFDLFGMPDNENQSGTTTIEVDPEPIRETKKTVSFMGKDFIVGKCSNCSQLILIDPAYYDQDHDKECEACNVNTAEKYLKFLKMKI